jgi:hypothetical protein
MIPEEHTDLIMLFINKYSTDGIKNAVGYYYVSQLFKDLQIKCCITGDFRVYTYLNRKKYIDANKYTPDVFKSIHLYEIISNLYDDDMLLEMQKKLIMDL